MNELCSNISWRKLLFVGIIVISSTPLACQFTRFTHNDPAPIFTAGNPLASFTGWEDCEKEQRARFSFSLFRQSADKGRSSSFTTSNNEDCNKDVELGDIHGRWNMVSLFYPEENGDTTIATRLQSALGIDAADIDDCFNPANYNLADPRNTDKSQLLGFFSVPIEYRKHGIRFEADIATCWDIGIKLQTGIASITQEANFIDKTCSGQGETCTILNDAGSTETIVINNMPDECKLLLIKKIMKQKDEVADSLGLDISDYCETDIEDFILSLYWSHCFEANADPKKQNDCWSHYTFTPFIEGYFSVPFSKRMPQKKLFALPFGSNNHFGYGCTGGFTINFIETVEIGIEAGFTKYSSEKYENYPVPTHDLQTGMFPRKATICKDPASTWTFGATIGSHHFIDCLSTYIQLRSVYHCKDKITILDVETLGDTDTFEKSNIKVNKMQEESEWSSHFVNVNFDYDISPNMALGFHWQAPLRQKYAYRPTTVMGSVICKF